MGNNAPGWKNRAPLPKSVQRRRNNARIRKMVAPKVGVKSCACDELVVKTFFHSRQSKSWTRWLVLGTCWATRCRPPRMATGWPLLRSTSRSVNCVIDLLESTLCRFTEFDFRVKPSLGLVQLHQLPRTSPRKQQFTTSPPSWAVIPRRKRYRPGAPSRTGSWQYLLDINFIMSHNKIS